jgi:hypothetical protein
MSGKMTRAEKTSGVFKESYKGFIAKGLDMRSAIRETRRKLYELNLKSTGDPHESK